MRSAYWSDVPNLKPPPVEASGHQDSVSLQLSACAWGLQNISDSAWPRGLEVQGRDVQTETLAALLALEVCNPRFLVSHLHVEIFCIRKYGPWAAGFVRHRLEAANPQAHKSLALKPC